MFDIDWGCDAPLASAVPTAIPTTIADLIEIYQTDPVSTFHRLRYHNRRNQTNTLRRLSLQRGHQRIADLKQRDLKLWHQDWAKDGKASSAKAYMAVLRKIANFGAGDLEDADCERVAAMLRRLKIPHPKPRTKFLADDQVEAVRRVAHDFGWPSIALANAFQFETGCRQKDAIGEWVPESEPGDSILHYRGQKWMRGLLWSEIDADLFFTHVTSKKQKPLEVDLNFSPMVLEELPHVINRTADGPIVINEITGLPWSGNEFRRKWRMCAREAGIPDDVYEMDSRSGAFSEADQAGAPEEHIQTLATHSSVQQTRQYIRGSQRRKITDVQRRRVEYRLQRKEARHVA